MKKYHLPSSIGKPDDTIHRIAKILYYAAVVVSISASFIGILNWNVTVSGMDNVIRILNIFFRVIIALLIIGQFNRSIIKAILGILIFVMSWISYSTSGGWGPHEFALLILLSDYAEEDSMKKMLLWLYFLFMLVLIAMGISGNIKNTVVNFTYRTGYSLGFGHPNTVGAFLISILILLRISILKKHYYIFLAISICMACFTWLYAACRTAAILMLAYPVLDLVMMQLSKKNCRKIIRLSVLIPTILFIISLALSLYFARKPAQWSADANMMARFTLPAMQINSAGFSWFGKEIDPAFPLDNTYMSILLKNGVIWEIILLAILTYVMYHFVKHEATGYITAFSVLLVYSVMETCMLIPMYNIFTVFALSVGEPKEIKRNKENAIPAKTRLLLTGITVITCLAGMLLMDTPRLSDIYYKSCPYGNDSVSAMITKENTISQSFTASPSVRAVRMLMATFGSEPKGTYEFSLINADNQILEQKTIKGEEIEDCVYYTILLNKGYPAGKYYIQLAAVSAEGDTVAVIQNANNPYQDGTAYVNGEATEGDWLFEYAASAEDNIWLFRGLIAFAGLYIIGCIWLLDSKEKA